VHSRLFWWLDYLQLFHTPEDCGMWDRNRKIWYIIPDILIVYGFYALNSHFMPGEKGQKLDLGALRNR
jgi:hypothetical protein